MTFSTRQVQQDSLHIIFQQPKLHIRVQFFGKSCLNLVEDYLASTILYFFLRSHDVFASVAKIFKPI